MKNKTITVYELIGLMKDRKAPKKIRHFEDIYEYDDLHNDYCCQDVRLLRYLFINVINPLPETVEILPEGSDKWKDIEEYDLKPDDWSTPTQADIEIQKRLNIVIKNQKYLKEKLESKDVL